MEFTREAIIEDLATDLVRLDAEITSAETKVKVAKNRQGAGASDPMLEYNKAQGEFLRLRADRFAVRRLVVRWEITPEVDELIRQIMDGEVAI